MLSLSLRLCRRRFFRDFSTCITLRSKRTMDVPKSFPNITTVTNKPTMIVYHGNCPDGFGAAFCAWKALGEEGVKYVGCSHGDPAPDVKGHHVAVFDFCWSKPELQKVSSEAASFILLDHHVSAMKENQDEPNCYFDMNRSGATLAWDFFFPGVETPMLIRYVEDRDLWRWALPGSKEFNVAHDINPQTFSEWDKLLDPSQIQKQIEAGALIVKYRETLLQMTAKKATKVDWLGKRVAVCNSAIFQSELGNLLSSAEDCDFALIWNYNFETKAYEISLRSNDDDNDVSVVAKMFGGGGHKRASGCRWTGPSLESLFQTTLDK